MRDPRFAAEDRLELVRARVEDIARSFTPAGLAGLRTLTQRHAIAPHLSTWIHQPAQASDPGPDRGRFAALLTAPPSSGAAARSPRGGDELEESLRLRAAAETGADPAGLAAAVIELAARIDSHTPGQGAAWAAEVIPVHARALQQAPRTGAAWALYHRHLGRSRAAAGSAQELSKLANLLAYLAWLGDDPHRAVALLEDAAALPVGAFQQCVTLTNHARAKLAADRYGPAVDSGRRALELALAAPLEAGVVWFHARHLAAIAATAGATAAGILDLVAGVPATFDAGRTPPSYYDCRSYAQYAAGLARALAPAALPGDTARSLGMLLGRWDLGDDLDPQVSHVAR